MEEGLKGKTRGAPQPRHSPVDEPNHLSPKKAFILLLAILALSGAALLMTRPESRVDTQSVDIPESNNFALTNAQAIDRFRELDNLRMSAMTEKDPSLIPLATTTDSPLRELAYADIRELEKRDVTVKPRFETLALSVHGNYQSRILLDQRVLQAPRFFDEEGNLLDSSDPQLRTVRWELHLEQGQWFLFDSEVLSSRSAQQ